MTIANYAKINKNLAEAKAYLSQAEVLLLNELNLDKNDEKQLLWLLNNGAAARHAIDSFNDNLTHMLGIVKSGSDLDDNDSSD